MRKPKPTRMATRGLVLLALGCLAMAGAARSQDEAYKVPTAAEVRARVKFPVLRVPFMDKAPTIDGRLDPGEWEDSACYTGFWQDYSHDNFRYLAVREKQPEFYVSYDKENLYFAHRSMVFPEAAWLKCRGKYKDVSSHPDYGILWDDHIEFQLKPPAPADANGPFFKWLVNPIDTYHDFCRMPQAPGGEIRSRFDSDLEVKGHWDEQWWVTEMRIGLESLRWGPFKAEGEQAKPYIPIPIPDGTIWRHWGSRAMGGTGGFTRLFSAAVNGGWGHNNIHLVFDSKGVSAQVTRFGRIMRDQIDLSVQLKNHGERSETVNVGVYIENDEELVLMNEEEEFVELLPGEVKDIEIKRDTIGITPLGNAIWLDIRTLAGQMVYRSILMRYHHVKGMDGYKEHFVDGMNFSRAPRAPFEYIYQYFPSQNKLAARIDTDVYGVSDQTKTAVEGKVKLLTHDGELVKEMAVPLESPLEHEDAKTFGGRNGYGIMAFDELPEGRYKTVCLLYDADKKIVSDQTSKEFTQRGFPWEDNDIGRTDIVWDPHVPIQVDPEQKTVETTMHNFRVGPSGLPEQITIKGDLPVLGSQLRAPMRLEASAGGKRFAFKQTEELKQTKEWKSEVAFESEGAIGPVQANCRVQWDCDGYMQYDVRYKADEAVDTLELVIEFENKPFDLFGFFGTDMYGQTQDPRPLETEETGVVWNTRNALLSRELFYGNFTPLLMLGNGDRAFFWACDTDRGMKLLAENNAAQLEKTEEGAYALRIFLVNEPGKIEQEKHVQFYFTTLPGKPPPENRRVLNWKHRGLGGGPKMSDGKPTYSIHMSHEEDYALFKPKPIGPRPYTTANVVCWDMPSLRTLCYTGEFLGNSDSRPNPRLDGARAHPVTGRPNDTIFLSAHVGWRWGPSQVDCAVYWRERSFRLGGLRGWWWDHNFFATTDVDRVVGKAYDLPEHKSHAGGHKQYAFHYYWPRQFFKRLARAITQVRENGDQPFHEELRSASAHYGGFDASMAASFLRDQVHWEHSASYAGSQHHLRRWPIYVMRAFSANYTGLCGYMIDDVNYGEGTRKPGADPSYDRSMIAACLLHDVGASRGRRANPYTYDRIYKALEEFGWFSDYKQIEFIPYWRSQHLYKYGLGVDTGEEAMDEFATEEEKDTENLLEKVYVSFYRNNKTKKALVVIVNYNGEPVIENLVIADQLLGKTPGRMVDVEYGQPIPHQKNFKNQKPMPNTFNKIWVDRYQFRLLQVQ